MEEVGSREVGREGQREGEKHTTETTINYGVAVADNRSQGNTTQCNLPKTVFSTQTKLILVGFISYLQTELLRQISWHAYLHLLIYSNTSLVTLPMLHLNSKVHY